MKELFYRVLEHLLPRSEAWKTYINKTLSAFLVSFVQGFCFTRHFFDFIFTDIFPQKTRQLDLWEQQFGLITSLPTEQERRDRLDAQWKAIGGQSPKYIQDILQDSGFNVYVHEWWYYDFDFVSYVICGNTDAVCGNANAYCGNSSAQSRQTRNPNDWIDSDSVLVNKIQFAKKLYTQYVICGNSNAVCGNENAVSGGFSGIEIQLIKYEIPSDSDLWPYFWYVGGVDFGATVDIPLERKEEFETLILKIKPRQTWVGLFINYV